MNELKLFESPKFGQVRTVDIDGKIYFVAADVARSLGYIKPQNAIAAHCKGALKYSIPTNGGNQDMNIIPEGDVYRLAAKSELPGADEFESWIFDEVLPSIRKHGAYMTADTIERTLTDPDYLIRLATTLKEEREARIKAERQIEVDKPKVEFFDQVADSKDAIDIGSAAKVLNLGIGRNRLFEVLRDKRILMNDNKPYQTYIDRGYFRVIEQKYTKPDGSTNISIKTLVYQRGLDYIRKVLTA